MQLWGFDRFGYFNVDDLYVEHFHSDHMLKKCVTGRGYVYVTDVSQIKGCFEIFTCFSEFFGIFRVPRSPTLNCGNARKVEKQFPDLLFLGTPYVVDIMYLSKKTPTNAKKIKKQDS